jgi:hypothetical protein
MSPSMDLVSPAGDLIERYFKCWRDHDVAGLRNIFNPDARYEIEGKGVFAGITQIENYWQRNSERQKQVRVSHQRLSLDALTEQVYFLASFYDGEEKQWQSVGGVIEFVFTEDIQRIRSLSERYLKEIISFGSLNAPTALRLRPWVPLQHSFWRLLIRASNSIQRIIAILPVASWIGLTVICFVLFAANIFRVLFPSKFVYIFVAFLEATKLGAGGQVSPELQSEVLARVDNWLLVVTTLISAALALAPVFPRRRRGASLVTKEIILNGDDLKEMNKACRNAERIIVFSGDFSFLRDDQVLRQTFDRLNQSDKITLVSSRRQSQVQQELEQDESTKNLYRDLLRRGNILFDNPVAIKCSLYDDRGYYQFLYRSPTPAGGGHAKICILQHTDESYYLLEALSYLLGNLVTELKESRKGGHDPRAGL